MITFHTADDSLSYTPTENGRESLVDKAEQPTCCSALCHGSTLLILVTLGIGLLVRVSVPTWLHPTQPVSDQAPEMAMPTPDFNTSDPKSIFWYDLGGTDCVCKNSWSRTMYWNKMFTGFSFNVPHTVAPLMSYFFIRSARVITIAILVNEMIEELLLGVAGRWGFVWDPPADAESRYDSLIRDTLCCLAGLHLGMVLCEVLKVPLLVQTPIRFNWDVHDRHSIVRAFHVFIMLLTGWQVMLVYNTDYGKYHWQPANILLCFAILYFSVMLYAISLTYWKDITTHHRVTIAIGFFLSVMPFIAGMIYPLMDEIWWITLGKASLAFVLAVLELLLILGNKCFIWCIFGSETLPMSVSQTKHVRLYGQLDLSLIFDHLREEGRKTCSLEEVWETAERVCAHDPVPTSTTRKIRVMCRLLLMPLVIAIAIVQPLHWDGAYYHRHWCGNPLADGSNGCLGYVM
eukprot:TRINITY_DN76359_c0_g1_i1.p1 TRINITY_DN76359_c0_g1~~TRINITY_DN76359_c0_g1_i1.p1  ORF type:complete len:459 (+),score=5.47 TRINITY_DN76359_c0_g1_i1:83-1459(+)